MNKQRLLLFVLLLSLPIEVFSYGQIHVVLADVAALISLPTYLFFRKTREKSYLNLAIEFSLISACVMILLTGGQQGLRPFLSVGYFYKVYLLFFAGQAIITSQEQMTRFLSWSSITLVCLSLALMISVIMPGGQVRENVYEASTDTYIAVSGVRLFGLKLLGEVNSLGVFCAASACSVFCYVWFYKKKSIFYVIGILALIYLSIATGSRGAVLGLIVFIVLFSIYLSKKGIMKSLIWLALSGALALAVLWGLSKYQPQVLGFWQYKMARSMASGDITTGRLTRYGIMLSDLARQPIFGNGFHGIHLYKTGGGRERYEFRHTLGATPHHQYLGALWKMGMVAATFYFLFLYRCFRSLYLLSKTGIGRGIYSGLWTLALVYIVIFCNVQDALTSPMTGPFMIFVLGGAHQIYGSLASKPKSSPADMLESSST